MELPIDYTVIDIETTGKSNSDIIELAAVRVRNNSIVDEFETLVKPSVTIPDNIINLTGITNELVEKAPAFNEILNDFINFIGNDILIGHNINNFDMRIISRKALEACGIAINNETVDTLTLSRKLLPIKQHGLDDLCKYYNVPNDNAHRAMSDVIATHQCYQHMKNGDINENYVEEIKSKKLHKPHYSDETKALQTLQEMLSNVACDGILTAAEVFTVKSWLEQNKHLSGNYPFDVAYSEIEKALLDGILEAHELNSLLNTFIMLTDPVSTCSCECSSMNLSGVKICLSGEFTHGTKSQIAQLLTSLGAEMSDHVTKKVNMLIVGDMGSKDWSCGNYGGKIKKAIEMQNNGSDIKILNESDFYKSLEVKQVYQDSNFDENITLNDYISKMIEQVCDEQNVESSFINIVENKNTKSVWICDPKWVLDFKGKQKQNAFTVAQKESGYEITLSIGRTEIKDFLPTPAECFKKETLQGEKIKTTLIFDKDCPALRNYLSQLFAWELKHFNPSNTFSCCSKYTECSDALKCIHENSMYARGCEYRKNLENGKIFYGKNKNIE